ncbi:uncharacterized protein LAESUDRAFT_729316 [Laetiporus sulphureus 93-53]|uniref:Uncharacterized protein n=1 Tax=Laetiporus sulphureus 93-53 TaxID=1314785 RepID=A0A165CR80_9APHY|nr:uncharacterized protein LAESUDRAFT_729316 [Laetiporus sulphureus 93-53]KZT03282.1 hypothetical protein LAESUDRAFT_729316 [Laetiporus sulphureus 93-53]
MAQARISLPSKITYSQSNPASLAQSDHGAKTPGNNKGAFITDKSKSIASSAAVEEEVGSEVQVPSEPDADSEDNLPSQSVPRTSRSDDGQSSELLMGGHSEWPSGSAPLRTGADPIPSSPDALRLPFNLSGANHEPESLVIGYPILVPAELGDTVWERGVDEEDIFLPRDEHSGGVLHSFCDDSYWSFLRSTTPDSKFGQVDSRTQEEPSAVRARDFAFALALEYERERCLDRFADGASYASVLEQHFGMDMDWSAPQMSIRKRATEPFIFAHQYIREDYDVASTSPSARKSIKAVFERGRSQSPKVLCDHAPADHVSIAFIACAETSPASDTRRRSTQADESSGQREGLRRLSPQKSMRGPLSSTSPSRTSPERQAIITGEEFRKVVCAAAAPPVFEVDSHAISCQSPLARSRASSSAFSRGSSPIRSSSRSPSQSSSSSDSSYVPSDAEDTSGASQKWKSRQQAKPQAVKGDKARWQDGIPSSAVAGEKRKRATLASRQPPSTKTNINRASTSIPKRPRVYAVDRHGDIHCPWPDCSHSASVLQMRHHLSKKHRHDAPSCYWPGCQTKHFSSAPRHIDDHHLKIEWVCPACHSTFKSERSGNRHIRQSCEAWQGANVEEVKENWISDDDGQQSTRSELKSLGNERVVDERPNKHRRI